MKKQPVERELLLLEKKETGFALGKSRVKDARLNKLLADRIPDKLDETLEKAFIKSFTVIFEKGTGAIEKTFDKDKIKKDFMVKDYAVGLKNDRKSFAAVRKSAGLSGAFNTALSGAAGIGMGVLGIGIPDIPVFTAVMVRSIFETALRYGYSYESEKERIFALFLIRGAFAGGDEYKEINFQTDRYITEGCFEDILSEEDGIISRVTPEEPEYVRLMIKMTAKAVSDEILYMKFLQGIPIAGVIGGAYDLKYMRLVTEYAELKYRKRFLFAKEKQG